MKKELKLIGIRGTIFVPMIQFSWELVQKLQSSLEDYIPSVNTSSVPIFTDGDGQLMDSVIIAPGEWSLTSPDKKQQIIFQAQKIDLIREINENYTQDLISMFGKFCQSLFSAITEFSNMKCTRIAIAPMFEYAGNRDSIIAFANNSFNANELKNAKLDNCDFSQVFRIPENISGSIVTLNYLSKFYAINKVASFNGMNQLVEVTRISFDINSKVDPNVIFNLEAIRDFFTKVSGFCEDFLSFYFNK